MDAFTTLLRLRLLLRPLRYDADVQVRVNGTYRAVNRCRGSLQLSASDPSPDAGGVLHTAFSPSGSAARFAPISQALLGRSSDRFVLEPLRAELTRAGEEGSAIVCIAANAGEAR